jgi:hypothetical protein
VNFNIVQTFRREHPAATRDASTGKSGAGSRDCDSGPVGRGIAHDLRNFDFVLRNEDFFGVSGVAGGVAQVRGIGRKMQRF